MRNRFTAKWLFTLVVVGLFAAQAFAQSSTTGAISGTVTDPSNAVVANATVMLTNTGTGVTATTTANTSGSYNFPLLGPGAYKVTVKQTGFRSTEQTVPVAVGQTTTANIQLQVGQGSEVVEVTGAAPLLQTEDANISTSFSARQVDLIPNGGNDLTAVAQTAPGIQMNTSSGGGYGNFTAFGLPATSNLFTVNGNDENDPYLNLNNSGATNLLLGKNEVQETAVVSNGYTGQYGRMAGAQVDYVTKSGTDSWHGNALYYYNAGGFNANDWFNNHTNTPLPEEINNQWAASIGGPIKKDKLFFFFDTEGLRYILGTSTLAIIPTPAYAAAVTDPANFAANTAAINGTSFTNSLPFYQNMFAQYANATGISRAVPVGDSIDGSGNLGCGDLNVISPNTFFGGPVFPSLAAFGGNGTPNGAYGGTNAGGGQPCSESFRSTVGALSKEYILAGRVDYNMSNNDKFNFRVRADRGLQPTYTDPINPAFNATSNQPQDEGQMNWTHTFSPNVLNNLIISGLYYSAIFADPSQTKASALFGDGAGHGFTQIDVDTSAWSFLGGENFAFPQGRNVTQYMGVDDLSISRGNHALKLGVNYRRNDITDAIFGARAVTPEMITGSQTLLDGGYLLEIAQRFPTKLEQPMAIYSLGVYLQDGWKVNNSLKLTMTLRADRNSNLVCNDNCFSYPTGGSFTGIGHDNAAPYSSILSSNQNTMVPELEKVVLQPRFGFAWSPKGTGGTVVRGGLGLFSDLYPGTLADNFARNTPSLNSFALTVLPYAPTEAGNAETTAQLCNSSFNGNISGGGSADSLANSATTPAGCTPPSITSVTSQFKNPKYLEWNLEVQHSIGAKTSVTVNYVGNIGYDEFVFNPWMNSYSASGYGGLPGPNTTDPALATCPNGCSFLKAPDGHFHNVSELTNAGKSNYNGVTASVTRRFTAGFTGSFNYTFAHTLDMVSNGGILPYSLNDSVEAQFNPFCLRCQNYGPADYDVRHNISANYVWELPFKTTSSGLNRVVSGWSLAGTFFWHSGLPYTVFDGAMPSSGIVGNGSGSTYMATFLGGSKGIGCSDPNTPCLLGSQFAPVDSETGFGNIGRNAFRGANYFNSDLSVMKMIPVTERVSFGLGATAYNVFNHASFSNPVSDISSGQFGTIQSTVVPPTSPYGAFVGSAVSGRMIQLHARLVF